MTQTIQPAAASHTRISRRRRAVLPHLGNFFFGKLYHAVTGGRRLPRALFRRGVANGLNREALEVIFKQARDVEHLHSLLLAVSENCLQKAIYWNDVGVKSRARDHYLDAALWGMHAALLLGDSSEKSQLLIRSAASYSQAAPYFTYPAEAVTIPYLSSVLHGYLRLPVPNAAAGSDLPEAEANVINVNHPCVILFNGFGLPKEELHYTENAFLSLGIATLSFDYPDGRFDTAHGSVFAFDVPELADAISFYLSSRSDIDITRISLYGTSLGGRVALSVAQHLPSRYRSVCVLSTPFELGTDLDLLLSSLCRELAVTSGCNKSMLLDLARRTPLRAQLEAIGIPTLVVGGGKDLVALSEETKAIYELVGATDKKLIICPAAGHNCYEMMPSLRHEIAQWLRQRM